jgi:ubiquinone/menaquinone biosynthesis C-methylase UbiE
MRRIDYDVVASTYNSRYDRNRYEGVRDALWRFIGDARDIDVAEIGCGTGHWLAELAGTVRSISGIDPSWGMLRRASADARDALLVQARAEAIPMVSSSVDRVFCINAFHHFTDRGAFAREARRILRPDGGVMIVGLDPHTGLDHWWVYDYFPSALDADRARYPSTATIRAMLDDAGFSDATTSVAQHLPVTRPFSVALERGHVDQTATSQLMMISDAEYAAGFQRMMAEQPVLRSDLRLFATIGRV